MLESGMIFQPFMLFKNTHTHTHGKQEEGRVCGHCVQSDPLLWPESVTAVLLAQTLEPKQATLEFWWCRYCEGSHLGEISSTLSSKRSLRLVWVFCGVSRQSPHIAPQSESAELVADQMTPNTLSSALLKGNIIHKVKHSVTDRTWLVYDKQLMW